MVPESEELVAASKTLLKTAKATYKALDVTDNFGAFIAKFIAGPLEQGVGIFEDKLRYMRWERQIRLMEKANELLVELGENGPKRPLPLKLAIPLFQAASLEDDDSLQDMWVRLLVNSSRTEPTIELSRAYIDILERLSPLEALILDKIYPASFEPRERSGIVTMGLPKKIAYRDDGNQPEYVHPSQIVIMALANLSRLGCITPSRSWSGFEDFTTIHPTLMGRSLTAACRLET